MTASLATTQDQPATAYPGATAALLAGVAGYVDATTYLAFSGLFVAQATGSLVVAASAFETGSPEFLKIAAIPAFLAAGIATAAITRVVGDDRRRALAVALAVEAACVGLFTLTMAWAPGNVLFAGLSAIAAMGVQSALCRLFLSEAGSTNVMTTNLTQMALNIEAAIAHYRHDGSLRDALRHLHRPGGVILGFLAGVIAGSLGYQHLGVTGLVAITVILGLLSLWMALALRFDPALGAARAA